MLMPPPWLRELTILAILVASAGAFAWACWLVAVQVIRRRRVRRRPDLTAEAERFCQLAASLQPTDLEHQIARHLLLEVARQDLLHPVGFPATRDGIRLAIAVAADDELNREAYEAWRAARCKCDTPLCDHADWSEVGGEMLQAMAVVFRAVRSITEREARKATEKARATP